MTLTNVIALSISYKIGSERKCNDQDKTLVILTSSNWLSKLNTNGTCGTRTMKLPRRLRLQKERTTTLTQKMHKDLATVADSPNAEDLAVADSEVVEIKPMTRKMTRKMIKTPTLNPLLLAIAVERKAISNQIRRFSIEERLAVITTTTAAQALLRQAFYVKYLDLSRTPRRGRHEVS